MKYICGVICRSRHAILRPLLGQQVCPQVRLTLAPPTVGLYGQRGASSSAYNKGRDRYAPAVPKNMILRHCSPNTTGAIADTLGVFDGESASLAVRPLVVIMAWMLAKDKHLEKYRQLWFRRGFDVLTVRTSPLDLLLPPVGGKVVASNLVRYLLQMAPQYRDIVVHAFSVGGYQFGEFLLKLQSSADYNGISESVRGVICDSIVYTEDAAPGLSRAMSRNAVLQPALEASIALFLKLFYFVAVKHYEEAAQSFFDLPLRCPGLVLYSEDDVVSSIASNRKLAQSWSDKGLDVESKCWQHSTHVLHYRDHTVEYEQLLDNFIRKMRLRNSY